MFITYNRLLRLGAALTAAAILIALPATAAAQCLGFRGERHATVGLYVKDLAADTMVIAKNIDRGLTPASVTKALTTACALRQLGPAWHYLTPVWLVGDSTVAGPVWHGTLTVTGVGDPTVESDRFEDNLGFCDSIAAALTRLGIRRIDGGITVESTLTDQGPADTWEISDTRYSYGTGHYGLNYKGNLRRGGGRRHQSNGRIVPDTHPARTFERDLRRTLAAHGITVGGAHSTRTRRHHTDFDSAFSALQMPDLPRVLVYTHRSPELLDIARDLMHRSDNMWAEGTLRLLAPDSGRDSALAVEDSILTSLGADTEFITLRDGSGLSRSNRYSPRFLASVLEAMAVSPDGPDYISLFPVAGRDGTMKNFLKDTPLEGRAAFKTGSMNGIQCYAGYILGADNLPTHSVVIMVNGFKCPRADLRAALTRLLLSAIPS